MDTKEGYPLCIYCYWWKN